MDAYIYRADLYCIDCARKIKVELGWKLEGVPETKYDSDEYPKGPEPDGGGEADCPQHCGCCDLFLENPLTGDGEEYVRQAFKRADKDGDPEVLWDWYQRYTYLVEDRLELSYMIFSRLISIALDGAWEAYNLLLDDVLERVQTDVENVCCENGWGFAAGMGAWCFVIDGKTYDPVIYGYNELANQVAKVLFLPVPGMSGNDVGSLLKSVQGGNDEEKD